MNFVINEEKSCMDIQIYDLVKAFDSLWLEDCMNDVCDSLPTEEQDDKLALLYEANVTNLVAVNTPVGLTKRVNMPRIVMQGATFGPILCSNSIDKVGKTLYQRGESCFYTKISCHQYHYRT